MIPILLLLGAWAAFTGDNDNPSAFRGFVLVSVIALLFLVGVVRLLAAIL
jgi:hypothetical protein